MKSIYELQQIANRLRAITEVNSISPEDTFGLQSDVLEYLADMEQNADGLGIHKVYSSKAAMMADGTAPVGSNGKPLRFGQLVAIYDTNNKSQEGSGDVYAYQKGNEGSPWLLMGNLGSVYVLQEQLDSLRKTLEDEVNARGGHDEELNNKIQQLQQALDTLTSGDASDAIDNFNEVLAFLADVKDDETLTGKLQELKVQITAIETTVGKNEAYFRMTIEKGTIDDEGNDAEGSTRTTSSGGSISISGTYEDVRTQKIKLQNGTYRVSVSDGKDIYLYKYNNGDFAEKVAITSPYEFTVSDGMILGQVRFNQIRLAYSRNSISAITRDAAALLYGTVGNLLSILDNSKADQKEFEALQEKVDDMEENVENLDDRITDLNGMMVDSDEALAADNNEHHSIRFGGIVTTDVTFETVGLSTTPTGAVVVWCEKAQTFALRVGQKYYNAWKEQTKYMDANTFTPYSEKQYISESSIYMYDSTSGELKQVGGSSVSSIFNATNEVPIKGYYTLCDKENTGMSAVHAAWTAKKAVSGLIISFEIAAGIWKTYQYIGKTITEANWVETDNWKDFGSLAAGSETYIVIDQLCGAPEVGQFYTLETAVSTLNQYQQKTGVTYAKNGLVISYKIADNVMETKQFQGEVGNFGEVSLWKDFGGGSKLEASDDPAKEGKDAFSTGGAYKAIPTDIESEENEGSVKLMLKNKDGETLSEAQFSVGTGTGGGGGTTVAINFEEDPFYVRAGGEAIVKAAIRSVTQLPDGSGQDNKIVDVIFINRTTKTTVASFRPNQASSSSLKSYTFEFDLSSLVENSGSVELQMQATDATGHTATRNTQLVGIDVTVESAQTLGYTKETTMLVGGPKVSIPMYRFPHNESAKGIQTKVEMFRDGAWQTLADTLVKDTYIHNVTIDPTGLGHGAYPIRIQGQDVSSGIEGNILHTAVMVIEQRESVSDYNKPIVVARWSDDTNGIVKLFETTKMEVACFKRDTAEVNVKLTVQSSSDSEPTVLGNKVVDVKKAISVEERIVGYNEGDTLTFDAICEDVSLKETRQVTIQGSLLDIAETEGAYYKISMAGRSNGDLDKTIKVDASDGSKIEIDVHGSNYSTNGFVLDTYGEDKTDGGRMALRVAENVTAECTDKPFSSNSIPTNGLAFSLTFMVKNIAKRNARIIRCMGSKLGFVMTGEKFYVTVNGDSDENLSNVHTTAATSYLDGQIYRIDVVVEPQNIAPYSGVMLCKIFQNGDEAACVPIDITNGFPSFDDIVHFDGTDADLYLYEVTHWNSYYDFIQAFNNYIVNLSDTKAMLTEYEQNQVMVDVTAEGTTKPRPGMQKLIDSGVMVCVMTRTSDKNLSVDGGAVADSKTYYPDYIEGIKDKKTTVIEDWYIYYPDRPWCNLVIEALPVTNQGTSTLAYPVKNKKAKAKKAKRIRMLMTREQVIATYGEDETILADYDDAAALAAKKKIRVAKGSNPINTITIKVDFSDSAGANNCALMQLMNETQIALGGNYMTPAQRYGTNGKNIHTSIDGVTCALFRTDYRIGQDKGSVAATLPENAYFHSKANFNVDKDNPSFFGFEDIEGYNKGCVNYGDFKEMVTPRGEDIDEYKAEVLLDTSKLVPGTLYMISEFCGPEFRFIENDGSGSMVEVSEVKVDDGNILEKTLEQVLNDSVSKYDWGTVYKTSDGKYVQYKGGVWKDTTGSMTFDEATQKWSVKGRVLNPVECYEYRQYQEFCWQQGVNTVDDMLEILHTDSGDVPIWSTYYESRYPDDDDLNALYAAGKKVPYRLFAELQFCQQCNQNLTDDAAENAALNPDGSEKVFNGAGASTTITLDGETVPGTTENRLLKWQREMHKWFCPESTNCYIVSSDYKATVDQRAKNMMITFYLETMGLVRAYFNHWYDGDSVDEADNDCYLTIPWDMDGRSHLYQGWDGVMFSQTYTLFERGEGVWTDDDGTQLTLHDTATLMRQTKTSTGLDIFSADGCYRYWMTNRILKWPKVVSSFDGERKYIETATAAENRYPALHGLRLDSLPAFQRKRFAFRDGYYQCGDLFKKFFSARMMGPISVKITAEQDGYFAMGVDSTSSAKYSCYLKAGESYTFTDVSAGEGGKLIYIFGADKLSELDLSGCTPQGSNWALKDCTLLRKLILGGSNYVPAYTKDILSILSLGQMPFLEEIDIRNTMIMNVNATGCPRLKKLYASGSLLQTFTPAESSPVSVAQLPSTMTDIKLVNLPSLSYPGGLAYDGLNNIGRMYVRNCPKVDGEQLLNDAISAGANIQYIHLEGLQATGPSSVLITLKDVCKAIGLDTDGNAIAETGRCSGMSGRWVMTDFIDDDVLSSLKSYFPNLDIHNSQYSHIYFNDDAGDPQNITNADNNTGYEYSNEYAPSAHISKIWNDMKPVIGIYDKDAVKMNCIPLDETNYAKLADGRVLDNTYDKGEYDAFMLIPHYWYKGVNEFKSEKKHFFLSTEPDMPISSAKEQRRMNLDSILFQAGCSVCTDSTDSGIYDAEGNLKIDASTTFVRTNSSYNAYRLNVEGMKLVRWPGIASSRIGAIFVDGTGTVIDTYNLTGMSSETDFNDGDYAFTSVPQEAKYIIFAVKIGFTDDYALAVDSNELEAVEPDWVEHKPELVGLYQAAMLNGTLRSVTGVAAKVGDANSNTYTGWTYETDGHVKPMDPLDVADLNLHYTQKDFQNLAWLRGQGYQMIDYEMSKDIANLFYAIVGNRDAQAVCGQGRSVGSSSSNGYKNNYNSGYYDSIGKANSPWTSGSGNKVLGIEGFMACNTEWMDNVAVNIADYASFKKNKMNPTSGDPADAVWHIFDPLTKTERTVQGVNVTSGYCIGRVKFGRYADVVPSKITNDNSKWNQNYCDGFFYSHSSGRVVLRGGSSARAGGGVSYSVANNASSVSDTYGGARLAFRGSIELKEA